MTQLARLIPEPRLHEIESVELRAPPEDAWEAVRHGDLARSRIVRALFAVRTLPSRLTGHLPEDVALRLDDFAAMQEPGFRVLGEETGREVVVGAIGKVWKLDIPFADVRDPETFAAFREPGWIRVAWALQVRPRDGRGTRVTLELRVDATDDASWRRFRRYFRIVGPGSRFIRRSLMAALARDLGTPGDGWRDVVEGLGGTAVMAFDLATPFLRPARSHWGLDRATAEREFPGDERVPSPRWSWTHGVEIDVPAEDVWPWVAQVGVDRGGFYSYQWLENLVQCGLENAERIHPEWQLGVGDSLVLHPKVPALKVVDVEPGRWFLAYGAPDEEARAAGGPWVAGSWLFFVEPIGEGRSRFISRFRSTSSDDLATRLAYGPTLTEPIGFAMDRRMLLGVKKRAERHLDAGDIRSSTSP